MDPIPTGVRSLLFGLVSMQSDQQTQKSLSPHSVIVWQRVKLSDITLGTLPLDSQAADDDVKKSNRQTSAIEDTSASH